MSRIRSINTLPERRLFTGLRSSGIYFSKHATDLPGKPDIVLRKIKIAIFVDGDFWHGWRFSQWKHKLKPYWKKKIKGNIARDKKNHAKLRRNGWRVIRVWEHDLNKNYDLVLEKIVSEVRQRKLLERTNDLSRDDATG